MKKEKIMEAIEFKHDLNRRVKTIFGKDGIITRLGYDDGGECYYVKTSYGEQWYREDEILEVA